MHTDHGDIYKAPSFPVLGRFRSLCLLYIAISIPSKDSGNLTLYIYTTTDSKLNSIRNSFTMCIVDQVTFTTCHHKSHFLLFPCSSGFSALQNSCNADSHIIRMYLDSASSHDTTNQAYCKTCYFSTLKMIREDHARRYLDLEREARSLGWSKADISGSLTEMQLEMDESMGEWKASYGQDDEGEEQTLDAFAESIRFRFGPTSVEDDHSSPLGSPYRFSAGNAKKAALGSLGKAQSRALSRARARKAGKLYTGSSVPASPASCKGGPERHFRPLVKRIDVF